MTSSGDTVYSDIKVFKTRVISDLQKNQLDIHASHFFYDVRPKFTAKQILNTPQALQKFLAVLWVTQEILKILILNPTWAPPSDRPSIRELKWEDKSNLENETSENTRLLLRHLPLRKQIEKRARDIVQAEKPSQNPRPTTSQADSVILHKRKTESRPTVFKDSTQNFLNIESSARKARKSIEMKSKGEFMCMGDLRCLAYMMTFLRSVY